MEKVESKEMKLREERSVDMFSKLPLEVTNNILLRLPFKSVAKGRCVSKKWCNILTDSKFLKMQLTQLSNIESDVFFYYRNSNNETALTYIEETDENTFSKNPVKPFKVHDYDYVKSTFGWLIKIWGSCNGFVCLSRINLFNPSLPENPFYVFNPITGECIELPHLEVLDGEEIKKSEKSAVCSSGFGFDESKQEFKVVLVMFTQCESDTPAVDSEVIIYTLGSPSWRKKTCNAPGLFRSCEIVSVYFHGCFHWLILDENSRRYGPLIVSFDLGVEEFGTVPTPGSKMFKHSFQYYSIGVLEGNLASVEFSPETYIHVWVMKRYKVKKSWVRQFSIEHNSVCRQGLRCRYIELVKLTKKGELLFLCNCQYLVSYNITGKWCRFLRVEGVKKVKDGSKLLAHPLVGSLISLKSAYGVSKRSTSDKEKDISLADMMFYMASLASVHQGEAGGVS